MFIDKIAQDILFPLDALITVLRSAREGKSGANVIKCIEKRLNDRGQIYECIEDFQVMEEVQNIRYAEVSHAFHVFWSVYAQLHPRYTLLHMQHLDELNQMMQAGKDVKDILEFDEEARGHYISLGDEAWIVRNESVRKKLMAIRVRPTYKEKVVLEAIRSGRGIRGSQMDAPSSGGRGQSQESARKAKKPKQSKAKQFKLCFKYNEAGSSACKKKKEDCPFKHKCSKCFGDHGFSKCDGRGPGFLDN